MASGAPRGRPERFFREARPCVSSGMRMSGARRCFHFQSGNRQDLTAFGRESRAGPGKKPQESWGSSLLLIDGWARPWSAGRSYPLGGGRRKHRRERGGRPPRRSAEEGSGEAPEKPRRASAVGGPSGSLLRYGPPQGTKPWSRGASRPPGPQSSRMRCQKRQEGCGAERRTALRRGKALEGEPQERHRPTWPGSSEGGNRQEGEKP
jgi:hypothetical protein